MKIILKIVFTGVVRKTLAAFREFSHRKSNVLNSLKSVWQLLLAIFLIIYCDWNGLFLNPESVYCFLLFFVMVCFQHISSAVLRDLSGATISWFRSAEIEQKSKMGDGQDGRTDCCCKYCQSRDSSNFWIWQNTSISQEAFAVIGCDFKQMELFKAFRLMFFNLEAFFVLGKGIAA